MAESGLDLRAVDTLIQHRAEMRRPHDSTLDALTALLVHVRALRAVLEAIEARAFIREDQYHTHESWRELMQWIGQRTAVVLRGAQDPEG